MSLLTCVAAFYNATEILNFGAVKGKRSIYDLFCKQWKGISFPACWGVPQTPRPDKNVRAEHHAGHGGLRVQKDASLPEA